MTAEDLIDQLAQAIGDQTLSSEGAAVAGLTGAMLDHVTASQTLSPQQRSEFEKHASTLIDRFEAVLRLDDSNGRELALKLLLSGLYVSLFYAGGPLAADRLNSLAREELNKESVERMVRGRMRPEIKAIVHRLASELWEQEPDLTGRAYKTAMVICGAVIRETNELPDVPKEWRVSDPLNPTNDESRKAVERIKSHMPVVNASEKRKSSD